MQINHSLCKRIAFTLLALLVVVMAAATIIGNAKGIDYAGRHIYYAWWFATLWFVMTVCGMLWLWKARPLHSRSLLRKNFHLWLIHGSLCVILLGAAISAFTSWSGQVHLRLGEKCTSYMSEEDGNPYKELPFTMELTSFDVATHSGTTEASNYTSRIKIGSAEYVISMNHVAAVDGIRFYQASYDSDRRGSVLLVRSDRWGQPVTYGGYALLLLSMIVMFAAPGSGLRRALGELRKMTAVFLLLAATMPALAQSGQNPHVLPREVAENFGKLNVAYGGRICPMQTLAQDFCRKIYGKSSFGHFTAEQVMTGWLFWPDEWNCVPIIQVKSRALRQQLDVEKYASFNDFFFDGYRLGPMLGSNDSRGRAAAEVDDRIMLVYTLRRGELFKLFPARQQGGGIVWVTPTDSENDVGSLGTRDSLFVKNIFTRLFQDAVAGNNAKVAQGIRLIYDFQQKHGGDTLPDVQTVKAERLYNSFELPTWLYRINLTIGLVLFLVTMRRSLPMRPFAIGAAILGVTGYVALTCYMALRTMVSERLPLGNGYETMLTVAWFVMLIGALLWRKGRQMPVVYSIPFLASGFFLLVASLSQSGAEITQLMPVLNSPLLSMHVSIIMLSYALLSFTFLISIASLHRTADAVRARWQSLVILYPAIALLAVGIFLGAVWANVSWGRYWGWDPKEVWALITLIVYIIPIHFQSLPRMANPRIYHIYMIAAFATVLMTYFGVNYVLTGLHSYA